jgi:hypothetical protein
LLASSYTFSILNADLNGVTGHHSFTAQIEETFGKDGVGDGEGETIKGIPETHGIEITALERKFNGDIVKWRDSIQLAMLERHQKRANLHREVMDWRGKKFAIDRN